MDNQEPSDNQNKQEEEHSMDNQESGDSYNTFSGNSPTKRKEPSIWLIRRVLDILNIESLDEAMQDSDGENTTATLGDTLESAENLSHVAKVKAIAGLYGATDKQEELLGLLVDGYSPVEIAKKWNVTISSVTDMIARIRKNNPKIEGVSLKEAMLNIQRDAYLFER